MGPERIRVHKQQVHKQALERMPLGQEHKRLGQGHMRRVLVHNKVPVR